MKRTLMSVAAAVASLMIPLTAVKAQTLVPVYNVPFSFNAQGVELEPGKYTVSQIGMHSASLKGNHKTGVMFITGFDYGKGGPSRLTFNKYGNKYFLRQVTDLSGKISKIPVSDQEREIMKRQLDAKLAPATVTLIAQR